MEEMLSKIFFQGLDFENLEKLVSEIHQFPVW